MEGIMEISCPNCSKKYRVEDSLIPAEGRKVRCRRCEHVFSVSRPEPEQSHPEDVQVDLDFDNPEKAVGGGTIRISQDQIDASIRKMNQPESSEPDPAEEPERDIQLDLDQEQRETAGAFVQDGMGPSVGLTEDDEASETDGSTGLVTFRVRIDGKEYDGLEMGDLKEWIKEDRLLENDEVSREGSNIWARAESIPDLKKAFKLHIYEQRKQFDEVDNPYLRFKAQQDEQTARPKEGFFSKVKRMLGMG